MNVIYSPYLSSIRCGSSNTFIPLNLVQSYGALGSNLVKLIVDLPA